MHNICARYPQTLEWNLVFSVCNNKYSTPFSTRNEGNQPPLSQEESCMLLCT